MSDSSNKKPTHGVLQVDGEPTVVFDTICTKHRIAWLANVRVHKLLRTVWTNADKWLVGRYVIMPDHIHLFAWATDASAEYENWVRYWKSLFSKQHQNPEHRWQPDHWDTRIRSASGYEEKWNDVRNNPVRHQIVFHPEEWPFQGTLFDLTWEE